MATSNTTRPAACASIPPPGTGGSVTTGARCSQCGRSNDRRMRSLPNARFAAACGLARSRDVAGAPDLRHRIRALGHHAAPRDAEQPFRDLHPAGVRLHPEALPRAARRSDDARAGRARHSHRARLQAVLPRVAGGAHRAGTVRGGAARAHTVRLSGCVVPRLRRATRRRPMGRQVPHLHELHRVAVGPVPGSASRPPHPRRSRRCTVRARRLPGSLLRRHLLRGAYLACARRGGAARGSGARTVTVHRDALRSVDGRSGNRAPIPVRLSRRTVRRGDVRTAPFGSGAAPATRPSRTGASTSSCELRSMAARDDAPPIDASSTASRHRSSTSSATSARTPVS